MYICIKKKFKEYADKTEATISSLDLPKKMHAFNASSHFYDIRIYIVAVFV